jgi:hypothetical protein
MTKRPEEVFTPRAARVNATMYVERLKLENRLIDAFHGSKYIVIHGESGNGKTWLYKKVFSENSIHYDVVNLGQIANAKSLEVLFEQKLGELGYQNRLSEESNSSLGLKPYGVGVDKSTKVSTNYAQRSAFLKLLGHVRYRAQSDKRAALVLDNFESIIDDNALLQQLASLIITADDDSIADANIQIVVVGVPGNLKEAISKLSNAAPVTNRLTEIPEVARMTDTEAHDLIHRGFVDELKLTIDDDVKDSLYQDICWNTYRIAQHIHELCLLIAQQAERNSRVISKSIFESALQVWLNDSLSSDLAVIEGVMNARDTKVGRKNQALYALGICKLEDFKYSDIENILRDNFDVGEAKLNVSQILSGFASAANPLIRRTPKQDAWRFVSPKLKMAIRGKLMKDASGKLVLRNN